MYKRILVPVDGSPTSIHGLKEAVEIAKIHGSTIRLLHVVNEYIIDYDFMAGMNCPGLLDSLRQLGTRVLNDAERIVRQAGIDSSRILLETIGQRAASLIVQQAKDWDANLIVMGTHGRRGLARFAMGSDAEDVVRTAGIPVLLVRGPQLASSAVDTPQVEPVSIAG
jgi:nucleotide-binding universal stress UspA family protein